MTQQTAELDELRYPIGKFQRANEYNSTLINAWIADIDSLPEEVRKAVHHLSDEQLDTPYRDGGWTIRQVVHHLADSHLNAYTRIKLALTEDDPTIKTYNEKGWAELSDGKTAPVELSLILLSALHKRWVYLLKSLNGDDFEKVFFHPDQKRTVSVKELLGLYSWHSKHHLGHITGLIQRRKWQVS